MADSIAAQIQKLAAPLQAEREQAIANLVSAGKEIWPQLLPFLSHSERGIRTGIALVAGGMGATEALGPIAEQLRIEEDPSARPLLLRACSELTHPKVSQSVVALLIKSLTDADLFVRALACTALGRIGCATCEEALKLASRDSEEWVRSAAKRALTGQRAETAAVAVSSTGLTKELGGLQSLKLSVQQSAKEQLLARGVSVIPHISPLLWHDSASTRRVAAEILGQLGSPDGIAPLLRLLAEPETSEDLLSVALHALAAILRINGPEGVSLIALQPHLGVQDPYVRAAALNALIQFGGKGKMIATRAIIDDEDDWVQFAGTQVLADTLTREDRSLRDLLLDGLVRVERNDSRVNILRSLGSLLTPPQASDVCIVGPLLHFLRDNDSEIRFASFALLASVVENSIFDVDEELLTGLFEFLEASPEMGEDVLRLLIRAARPGMDLLQEPIIEALAAPDDSLARDAISALGKIGGRIAIEALANVANEASQGPRSQQAAHQLALLAPGLPVSAKRGTDDLWTIEQNHNCDCGAPLKWRDGPTGEELRCASCAAEYVTSADERLYAIDKAPLGYCACPQCSRKELLIRSADGESLICGKSLDEYIRPFNAPDQPLRIANLSRGPCDCCADKQALMEDGGDIVCPRSRKTYHATAHGFAQTTELTEHSVDAINEALLQGTLGIAESGVAAPGDDE
jgi:HEAT repeat protein